MIDPKDCTIIIPHLGGTKEQEYAFEQSYQSLQETTQSRILVVKNGDVACGHPRDIRVIEQGQNKATNAGVAITNTPWILITNDDMIYAPGWWQELFSEDRGCISPMLIEPRPGAPTFKVEFFGGAGGDFNKEGWLDFAKNFPSEKPMGDYIQPGFNLPFLIKRELWDTIGGYDINYDPWGSNGDSDLLYKIKLAGVQPYQNREAITYHFSQTSGTFEPRNQPYWQKNWDYFIEKWGFPRTDDGIWQATFEIPDEDRKFRPDWEGKYEAFDSPARVL